MNENPFENLRKEIEAKESEKERATQREKEFGEYLRDRDSQLRDIYNKIKEKYTSLVTPVLNNLKNAVYPECEVICFGNVGGWGTSENYVQWSIGINKEISREGAWGIDSTHDVWRDKVNVIIKFTLDDESTVFLCQRNINEENGGSAKYKEINAELSKDNLINALNDLHSPLFPEQKRT